MGETPSAFRGLARRGAACIVITLLSGCYRTSFQERNGPELQRVPIDRNLPTSDVRWSTFWGLKQDTWAPTACLQEGPDGTCVKQAPLCDEGAGQVTAGTVWYSMPLVLLSLGTAMPIKVTVYCATSRSSGQRPPVGP